MKKEFIVNINKIKQKYDCKGELIFRSALCLLLDYGKERCGNMDWVNDNKELINTISVTGKNMENMWDRVFDSMFAYFMEVGKNAV